MPLKLLTVYYIQVQYTCTVYALKVIRFVSTSDKFGICTVAGLNGTLVQDKTRTVHSRVNVNILASSSVPFRPTTLQVPNLALNDTKRIRVYVGCPYLYSDMSRMEAFLRLRKAGVKVWSKATRPKVDSSGLDQLFGPSPSFVQSNLR